jgi:Flp pilus assembly protein TadG
MNRQRGTAIIEFALVLPIILVLMFTVTEFGRAIQRYNSTAKVVRDAVRYMSMQRQGTNQAQARNLIVYGNAAGSGSPLDAALTPAMVPDPVWQTTGTDPLINTVTVRVTGYKFTPMVASVFGLALPNITFSDITATMRCPL